MGSGLAGRCALEKKLCQFNLDKDDKRQTILLGRETPLKCIVALPLIYDDQCIGAIELATSNELDEDERDFLEMIAHSISVQLLAIRNKVKVTKLLSETQDQKTELEVQQKELQRANLDLEEKAHELYTQQSELEMLNTELEASKGELIKKATELENANSAKSMFLANVSHELRTPLNSILILSKLLSRSTGKTFGEQEVKNANVIHTAGTDLLKLIDDILDLAKIESGHVNLDNHNIDTSSLIENIDDLFKDIAVEKDIHWSIETSTAVPKSFLGDQLRIEQILKNLLANSFKFTAQGSVKLVIDLKDSNLEFRVIDTGPGMDQNQVSRIFQAFEQGDNRIEKKFGGTGLGLSISKSLANRMDGDLIVESSVLGNGSTFLFTMPLALKKQILLVSIDKNIESQIKEQFSNLQCDISVIDGNIPDLKQYDSVIADASRFDDLPQKNGDITQLILILPDDGSWLAKDVLRFNEKVDSVIIWNKGALARLFDEITTHKRNNDSKHEAMSHAGFDVTYPNRSVLIVDDDFRNIYALKQVLEVLELTVHTAGNGLDAISFLKENTVDLVFMDTMMPVMDGLTCIRHIRSELMLKELPIVSLTAKAMPKDREECFEAGTSDYLSKPLDVDVILTTLSKWLSE